MTALSNSVGGIIVWGIDENEKQAARLDPLSEPITNLRLTHILSPGVSPALDYRHLVVKTVELSAGYVNIIYVPESHRPPHMVTARGGGGYEGRYYRRGLEGTVLMLDGDVRDALGRRQKPDLHLTLRRPWHGRDAQRLNVGAILELRNSGRAVAQHVAVTVQAEKQHWLHSPAHIDLMRAGWSEGATENGSGIQVIYVKNPLFPHLPVPLPLWGRAIDNGNLPHGLSETIPFHFETTIHSESTGPKVQRFVCRFPRSPSNWGDPTMTKVEELHGAASDAAADLFSKGTDVPPR